MLRRRLIYVLAACPFVVTSAGGPVSAVFVQKNLRWKEGPPDLGYEVAFGSLTAFWESGELVQVYCELIRDTPAGPVMFNLKSGYSVLSGVWKPHGSKEIAVSIRLVTREKLVTAIGQPGHLPGPVRTEVWALVGANTLIGASAIKTGRNQLVLAPVLKNAADFQELVRRYVKPKH